MYLDSKATDERLRAALPVLAVHALLALVLIRGLHGDPPAPEPDPLRLTPVPPVTVIEPEPPPPSLADETAANPLRPADPRPEGAASPPNLKAELSPFVAPEPIVRPPVPPPPTVTPSPIAGAGSAPSAGAAPVRGPGTGSGGLGDGLGSGAGGAGPGGGGGGDGDGSRIVARPPRWVCCGLSIGDVPVAVQERTHPGISVVSVIYAVEADGRVTGCRVSRSSGNRELDLLTCRLVERNYRFQPARNPAGRPIRVEDVGDDHEWLFEDEATRRPPRR
mgnify:CR=1 FL=1